MANISGRRPAGVTILGLGTLLVLAAACGGSMASTAGPAASGTGSGAGTTGLVMTAANATLGATVLVNRRGMTLYSLSAERSGRFICTRGATVPGGTTRCLSLWKPLLLGGGARPTGTVDSLGVIQRPDGVGIQVTYRGLPLYTFVGDHAPGDASGNGFKDVGTWLPVTAGGSQSTPVPATSAGSTGGRGY